MHSSKHKQHRTSFVLLVLLIVMTACAPLESLGVVQPRPNIILILTDDMDNHLLPYMPNTNKLIGDQGATFTNYFITTPLCCPSRTSTIRGQYAHNTNILANTPGFRNFFRNNREKETIATWLSSEGYRTALIGKYLNGYPITAGKNYVPPGWTNWHAFFHHDPDDDDGGYYFHYAMNENGAITDYEFDPEDYSADVLTDRSLDFIENSIADHAPFFLYISPTNPHGPSIPAPRHEGMLADIHYPRSPSFLTEDITPKPKIVIDYATVPGEEFQDFDADHLFQLRAESLLSIDEMVKEIVQTLEQTGQLDNTYIIFTSDNGFHLGEHDLSGGKGLPYTEDIKVPFLMRGPGIQPGITITQLTANIDLASTFAEIARVKTADFVDGRSILPLLQAEDTTLKWRNALLIEAGYTNRESVALIYRGIRTESFLYVEFEDGSTEYYDLVNDPYERRNIIDEFDTATRTQMHDWLEKIMNCRADGCREIEDTIPVNFMD